ncbi:MAG TPA: FAD-binding oxidoreductase [Rhizomicrobium sp.]|nr:FAD-binding oxidoreductase [Rhizomicrobium sp.]
MNPDFRMRWYGWMAQDEALAAREPFWQWLAGAMGMPALLATPPRAPEDIALAPPRLDEAAREKFAVLLGPCNVRQSSDARAWHACAGNLPDLLRRRSGALAHVPDAVLHPRREQDVLDILQLCAGMNIAAVTSGVAQNGDAGNFAACVAIDLSDMTHVSPPDWMAGLVSAEAGIMGTELKRRLAAQGLVPDGPMSGASTLGGLIARPESCGSGWLAGARVATPAGLLDAGPDLAGFIRGSGETFGIVTAASLRVRALPVREQHCRYLFPDFASGIAAIREAARTGLRCTLRLSDDGETRFLEKLARSGEPSTLRMRLGDIRREIRRFGGGASVLAADFADPGAAGTRRRFEALGRRLGAMALDRDAHTPAEWHSTSRDTFLDRGVGLDRMTLSANWSQLPGLYVAVRRALKAAMRARAPRDGAEGLVLAHVGHVRPDGANLNVTWLFARALDDEVAQAQAIRDAALAAARGGRTALEQEAVHAIKRSLDPAGILNPRAG